jgi:hypothetical protein
VTEGTPLLVACPFATLSACVSSMSSRGPSLTASCIPGSSLLCWMPPVVPVCLVQFLPLDVQVAGMGMHPSVAV